MRMKIKWTKLIWLILTDKKFRREFELVYRYAQSNYRDKRGDGASDVLLFNAHGYRQAMSYLDLQINITQAKAEETER